MSIIKSIKINNAVHDVVAVQRIYQLELSQSSSSGFIPVTVAPQDAQIYKIAVDDNVKVMFNTADLDSSYACTFQVWLDVAGSAVDISIPQVTWVSTPAPGFSSGSTRYVLAVRWTGTKFIAQLCYMEDLV